MSLGYAMLEASGKARMAEWLVPHADGVWREGRIWTLLTGPLLEIRLVSLVFQGLMIWMLLPALERWWGPRRFALFVALTAVAGTVAGTLIGLATGNQVAILGLDPTLFAAAVAFGILYARQPIQFFGVLPMTGRQFLYGMIGLVAVFILIGQDWEEGAAMAAAMLVAAGITTGFFMSVSLRRGLVESPVDADEVSTERRQCAETVHGRSLPVDQAVTDLRPLPSRDLGCAHANKHVAMPKRDAPRTLAMGRLRLAQRD